MRSIVVGSFFAVCLALAGCNPTATPADTGGGGGVDSGRDAASTPTDTGGSDTGLDAPAASDAGGECHDDYAGCTAANTEDHTGVSTFAIAATASFTYDHHCIRISAGTAVTMTNSTTHPLTAAACSTPGGPIPSPAANPGTAPLASSVYTFATAGHYGYHCENHGATDGSGMAGLIIVEGPPGADAGTDAGRDAGGTTADAGSDAGCAGVLLTVIDVSDWCDISDGTNSYAGASETRCVAANATLTVTSTPHGGFVVGSWFGTNGAPASGSPGATAMITTGAPGTSTCISTCCPFPGTPPHGCPTTNACP